MFSSLLLSDAKDSWHALGIEPGERLRRYLVRMQFADCL
jgi:hypothetical protein